MRTVIGGDVPMSLASATAVLPVVSAVAPARSSVVLCSRVPRNAGDVIAHGGTSGTGSYTLPRNSLNEALAWGAGHIAWCYFDGSSSADVASWIAAGIKVHGAINTSPSSPGVTVLPTDWAGNAWSQGSHPTRPSPFNSGYQRFQAWIDFATTCDLAERARKVSQVQTYAAMGVTSVQVDDPRDMMPWIAQSVTHAQMATGFRAWLLANTTIAERTAVALPSTLPADLVAWLTTDVTCPWYSWFHTGLDVPAQIDVLAGCRRVYQLVLEPDFRPYQIFNVWYGRYIRESVLATYAEIKTTTGLPLSGNMAWADPAKEKIWTSPAFDWALFETNNPPYPYVLADRLTQIAEDWISILSLDSKGKLGVAHWVPISPLSSASALVVTVGRQTIAQYYAWGAVPTVPWDIYMQVQDGVDTDGYRFYANYSDYVDLYDFARSHSTLLDGFYAVPDIGLVVSSDQYPDVFNAPETAQYNAMVQRIKTLMMAGLRPLLQMSATDWTTTTASKVMPYAISLTGAHAFRGTASSVDAWAEKWDQANVTTISVRYARISVSGSGAGSVLAWPRYNPTTGKRVVHLTNYAVSGNTTTQASVTLAGDFVDGRTMIIHRPGRPSVAGAPGSSISVDTWAIVEV